MRVLAVHYRQTKSCFSGLEELRISPLSDSGWFQAEHRPEGYRPPAKVARDHGHQPITRKQLVAPARSALLNVHEKSIPMKHECPVSESRVDHRREFRRYLRLKAGAR